MKYNELKDYNLAKHLIGDIDNNAGWLCFFLIFSRFEYALKRSGYVKDGGYLQADWEKFGDDIIDAFESQKCEQLLEAIDYLNKCPPRRQVLKDNKLSWKPLTNRNNDIRWLITVVKTVRNNLFHGGKYPSGPITDPSRDEQLIKHSIIVLKHLLYSSEKVKIAYFKSLEE